MTSATLQQEFLSPKDVAELLLVNSSKVVGWINSGQLLASNVTSNQGRRPRWRIKRTDPDDFLQRRANCPAPTPTRRRRKPTDDGVIQFYKE